MRVRVRTLHNESPTNACCARIQCRVSLWTAGWCFETGCGPESVLILTFLAGVVGCVCVPPTPSPPSNACFPHQNALSALTAQAEHASSAQRMEAEREAEAMRAALQAHLDSEVSGFAGEPTLHVGVIADATWIYSLRTLRSMHVRACVPRPL